MMFWQTYKNTFKNIFRSVLFWMVLIVVVGVIIHSNSQAMFGKNDAATGETIMDTDPRFGHSWNVYIVNTTQRIYPRLLAILAPVFAIVSTFIIAKRDWGDGFYEIEKAGGVRPVTYFFGRISALFTLNSIALIIFGMLSFHLFTVTRGMVEGMTLNEYLVDSTERVMRVLVWGGIPCILFYVTLTFMLGCLFGSGILSSLGSIGIMIAHYLCTVELRGYFPDDFHKYIPPTPHCVEIYLYHYDTRFFEEFIAFFGITYNQAVAAVCITLGCSVVFMAVSYLCIRRRTK